MTEPYVAKVTRLFDPTKRLTSKQRMSGKFDEEPRIGAKRLRKGDVLKLTAEELKTNEVQLKLLERAGAIKVEPLTVPKAIELSELNALFEEANKVPANILPIVLPAVEIKPEVTVSTPFVQEASAADDSVEMTVTDTAPVIYTLPEDASTQKRSYKKRKD